MALHTIDLIYDKPIISTRREHGVYDIRLHDEKLSNMFKGPFTKESLILFQKQTIDSILELISGYEDWSILGNCDDSMTFCRINTNEIQIVRNPSTEFTLVKPKERTYTKSKFRPVSSFPFTTRGSLCAYFNNIICAKLVSDINCLGPRKWIVEFNMKKIISILFETLGRRPTASDIKNYQNEKELVIIEKMNESSESARWVTAYDRDYAFLSNYIISFDQY
jgi:hypothetical protein